MQITFFNTRRRKYAEIDPDEIMLDSSNLPNFDTHQFEGRLEKPISRASLYGVALLFSVALIIVIGRSWMLQVVHGQEYRDKSAANILRPQPIFAARGVIYDRNGTPLVWNAPGSGGDAGIAERRYATTTGLAHVLGYVQYPSKDSNGFYYREDFEGVDGIEKYYNSLLQGSNGSQLIEVDARGGIVSQNIARLPDSGEKIDLSIDSRVQSALYRNIKDIAERVGFAGGAGVIMDVRSGEVLALASYPEYSPQIMSDRTDTAAVRAMLNDSRLPFLDRATDGLYTPGSIVKPYIAMGALNENVIDPNKVVRESGSISVVNPYDKTQSSVFKDWKDLGFVDMRHAIAMSSDVYFYVVGGGYKDQAGLGITRLDKYLSLFGFGKQMPPSFLKSSAGTIPTPAWKKAQFNEDWYLGDTYHTSIGQYGFQVTPVQVVRAVAAIANKGQLLVPTILKDDGPHLDYDLGLPSEDFAIVQEGMRMSVREGTSVALNVPYVQIAGKSGTAELGASKATVNSWITGFFPYNNPKYAFAVTLEKGSVHNLIGAAAAMRQQLDWMNQNTPEYFK